MTTYDVSAWYGPHLLDERTQLSWPSVCGLIGTLEGDATSIRVTRRSDGKVVMRYAMTGLKA